MSQHDDTLVAVFADPIKANIKWSDVERLLIHLGAELSEGRGSRVRIALKQCSSRFSSPSSAKRDG